MYEKQVKLLRYCAKADCTECAVAGCPGPQKFLMEAADAIEELSRRLEQELPRWIPVTERLPSEELCFYLCYTDNGVIVECLWTNNKYGLGPFSKWGWRLMDVPQYQRVTHWMPLPERPKEEET